MGQIRQRHTSGARCIEEENGKVGGNMISVGVVGSLGLLVVNASFGLCVQHLQVISSQGKRVSLLLTAFPFFFFFSFFFSFSFVVFKENLPPRVYRVPPVVAAPAALAADNPHPHLPQEFYSKPLSSNAPTLLP